MTASREIHADCTDTFDSRINMFACLVSGASLCDLRVSSCRPLQGQARNKDASLEAV